MAGYKQSLGGARPPWPPIVTALAGWLFFIWSSSTQTSMEGTEISMAGS